MNTLDSNSELSLALDAAAADELREPVKKIAHFLGQLSDEQICWRPDESPPYNDRRLLHPPQPIIFASCSTTK